VGDAAPPARQRTSILGSITGRDALARMDATAQEMERVYVAFATRILEVLDKEERLRATAVALSATRQRLEDAAASRRGRQDAMETTAQQLAGGLAEVRTRAAEQTAREHRRNRQWRATVVALVVSAAAFVAALAAVVGR
jgi:chromosome segregation ATPase